MGRIIVKAGEFQIYAAGWVKFTKTFLQFTNIHFN